MIMSFCSSLRYKYEPATRRRCSDHKYKRQSCLRMRSEMTYTLECTLCNACSLWIGSWGTGWWRLTAWDPSMPACQPFPLSFCSFNISFPSSPKVKEQDGSLTVQPRLYFLRICTFHRIFYTYVAATVNACILRMHTLCLLTYYNDQRTTLVNDFITYPPHY